MFSVTFSNRSDEMRVTRKREQPLGRTELIAVALGGMIGGGIFSILGVAVDIVGGAAPMAIGFFKRTYTQNDFAASIIGWLVVFGYISTLALYAFTFSSYFVSTLPVSKLPFLREIVAGSIILIFALINILSVKGMGKIEDILVYTKIAILLVLSGLFLAVGDTSNLNFTFNADLFFPFL